MLHRLRGSGTLRLLDDIRAAEQQPAEVVRHRQFQQLSRLLEHAERRVPYYREMFRSLGIGSRDIRDFDDFRRLPVLTKDIVRERGRDLVREDVPLDRLSEHHSGGSTGVPLTFYRDRSYMEASEAGTFRNLARSGWRPGDMVAFFWGWNDRLARMSRLQFELRQQLRRMYQFDPFQSGPQDMDRWIRTYGRIRPRVVLGYASTIARFAQHVERAGAALPPVLGVFTTAEKLYPPQRQVIERVLGARVFDCYGSSEVQNIAAECAHGRMHIQSDYVVVDQDAVPVGQASAPLLLTSLRNHAMPFIRYRNEDAARLLPDERCECGSGFPLMSLDVARVSDNFTFPGGRVVHGEFFTHLLYGSEGIASFQFHQKALDRLELLVVPGPGTPEGRDRAIRGAVRQLRELDSRVQIDVREVPSIPLSSAGKHRFTRSDVALEGV